MISSRLSLIPSSITRSIHVSQRKLGSKLSIDEQIKRIRESWPYEWNESEHDTDKDVMESEKEALVTKRCTTFSHARSPSKCDLDTVSDGGGSGGRVRSRSRSPSRTASISAKGNLTVR